MEKWSEGGQDLDQESLGIAERLGVEFGRQKSQEHPVGFVWMTWCGFTEMVTSFPKGRVRLQTLNLWGD